MNSALAFTLLAGCALLCVGGCASQSAGVKILIAEGCVVLLEGVSTQQADDILRTWEIDPKCKVEVRASTVEDA